MGYLKSLSFYIYQIVRIVFRTQLVCRRERGTQFNIKLPVFKKKKCSSLYNNFFVKMLCILFPMNEDKNSKTFLGWHQSLDPPNVFVTNHNCLFALRFTQYFSQYEIIYIFIIIDLCTSGIGPDNLMNVLKDCIIPYFGRLFFYCNTFFQKWYKLQPHLQTSFSSS